MRESDEGDTGFDETVAADSNTAPVAEAVSLASDATAHASTRAAASGGAPLASGGLAEGTQVARYRLLAPIGAGGMGAVWRARDTELARDVALKVVHPDRMDGSVGSEGTARLLREAQALAQLSHPNIVPVFDVGTLDSGSVWVAMEHVHGTPGDRWKPASKDFEETLDVYRQVAEGLTAAHAAGIVHRDFKPANFIVGDDGRVRVLDFGLARKSEARSGAAKRRGYTPVTGENTALGDGMTVAGAIMGTPAYMSPEQMTGNIAEAASDQYSFGVALWEALYGAHPYPAKTFSELKTLTKEGAIATPPGSKVPARYEQALRRALAYRPALRHASMAEFARAIARPTRRRWPWLAAGALALGVAGAVALQLRGGAASEVCPRDDGGWTRAISEETRSALETSYPENAESIERDVEARRAEWLLTRQATCRAHASGFEDAELFARRTRCLAEVREDVSVTVELVSRGTLSSYDARQRVEEARSAKSCTGAQENWGDGPRTPEEEALSSELNAAIRQSRVLGPRGLLETATRLVDTARALGNGELLGRALYFRASLRESARDLPAAEADFRESLEAMADAGNRRLAPQAWSSLVIIVGAQGRIAEARSLATAAKTSAKYSNNPGALALLEGALAGFAEREGKLDEAQEGYKKARVAMVKEYGEGSSQLAHLDNNLGRLALLRAQTEEAQTYFERVLDVAASTGSVAPAKTEYSKLGLAQAMALKGEAQRAIALYEEVLEAQTERLGRQHAKTADTLFMLGGLLASEGEYERALSLMNEGRAAHEAVDDQNSIAADLTSIGQVLSDLGRFDEAIASFERARTLYAELSFRGVALAATLIPLSRAYRKTGDCKRAAEPLAEARTLLTNTLGEAHEFTGLTFSEEAACALAQGNARNATDLFRKGLASFGEKPHMREDQIDSLIGLSQSLATSPKGRKEAIELARKAAQLVDASPSVKEELRRSAKDWLATLVP